MSHLSNKNKKQVILPEFKAEWIINENGFSKATIDFAEEWGQQLAKDGLTTSQIRVFYGEILSIKDKTAEGTLPKKDFLLLRPKVAYSVTRSGSLGGKRFKSLVDKAHRAVLDAPKTEDAFIRFFDLFKATLAYHKVKFWKEKQPTNLPTFQSNWILLSNGFEGKTIDFAEAWGKFLAEKRMSTSQIRNIHGELLRLDPTNSNFEREFLLLRPVIAYAAQRSETSGIFEFKELLNKMHNAVLEVNRENQKIAFSNFTSLYVAILSYHKMYESIGGSWNRN